MEPVAKGGGMPTTQTLVEPTQNDLRKWFKEVCYGDKCDVVTNEGETCTQLIKVSPTMVKWRVSGFTNNETELCSTIHFMEFLETWNDFTVH